MNKSEIDSSLEERTAVPRKLARLAEVCLAASEPFHLKYRHLGQAKIFVILMFKT